MSLNQICTWYVETYSDISTFHVDDHFFYFIANFTSAITYD